MNFQWIGLSAACLAGCTSTPSSLGSGTPATHVDGGDAMTLDGGDATTGADAGFVCTPPPDASDETLDFSGAKFDPAHGCLVGAPAALPICGCFHTNGHDTSTWCFAAPDGTAYFASSPDQCDIQVPAGWYATQTFGPSPGITPNAAQAKACEEVAAASTAMATYDRKGPPVCGAVDAGRADAGSLSACVFDARTFSVNGAPGYALQDIVGSACTGTASCTAGIAAPPFCGQESASLGDYTCTCKNDRIACTLVSAGLGIPAKGWCDGGDGTNDAG
jgi:hypothetical protein